MCCLSCNMYILNDVLFVQNEFGLYSEIIGELECVGMYYIKKLN